MANEDAKRSKDAVSVRILLFKGEDGSEVGSGAGVKDNLARFGKLLEGEIGQHTVTEEDDLRFSRMSRHLILREEIRVVFNLGFVIGDRDEVALRIEAVEGVGVVADVVDKEDAIEMVDFVQEGAGEEPRSF